MLDQLTVHRQALHRIPELGDQLPETRAYILSQLKGLRCRIMEPGRDAVLAFFDGEKPTPSPSAAIWTLCPSPRRPAFPSAPLIREKCTPVGTMATWPCF